VSDTYLQDFGLLRKQAHAHEVNDPMSGSARWEDLQMDLRKPHIPQPRRDSMPANRKLTIAGVTIDIKKPDAKLTVSLGFVSGGVPKYSLSSPKATTYRTRLQDSHRSRAAAMGETMETYCPYGSVAQAIRRYVRKARFATIPSVADKYREKVRLLWPARRIGR